MTDTKILHCPTHGDYAAQPIMFRGAVITKGEHCLLCTRAEADALEATNKAKEAVERQERIEKRFAQSGIPRGFANRTFESYRADTPAMQTAIAKAQRFADGFRSHLKVGTSLMFIGGIGTGKTHLAVAIAHRVMSFGHSVMYETAFDLVTRMRDCMRRDAETSTTAMMDAYGAIDLLVLDEIGIQGATDDVRAHLTNVIDRRYRNARPTIIISNLDRESLAQYLGDRIADRLRERASVVIFDWESQRIKARSVGEF